MAVEPITLGGGTVRLPSLKLRSIGDEVVVALADFEKVPWMEYQNPTKQRVSQRGNLLDQYRCTVLVVSGSAVMNGPDGDEVVAPPGTEATVFLPPWDVDPEYTKLGRDPRTGDVIRWRYERDERSSMPGGNDKRVRSVAVRDAKTPGEDDQVAACVALYNRRHQGGTTAVALGGGDTDRPFYGDEDPF